MMPDGTILRRPDARMVPSTSTAVDFYRPQRLTLAALACSMLAGAAVAAWWEQEGQTWLFFLRLAMLFGVLWLVVPPAGARFSMVRMAVAGVGLLWLLKLPGPLKLLAVAIVPVLLILAWPWAGREKSRHDGQRTR